MCMCMCKGSIKNDGRVKYKVCWSPVRNTYVWRNRSFPPHFHCRYLVVACAMSEFRHILGLAGSCCLCSCS